MDSKTHTRIGTLDEFVTHTHAHAYEEQTNKQTDTGDETRTKKR